MMMPSSNPTRESRDRYHELARSCQQLSSPSSSISSYSWPYLLYGRSTRQYCKHNSNWFQDRVQRRLSNFSASWCLKNEPQLVDPTAAMNTTTGLKNYVTSMDICSQGRWILTSNRLGTISVFDLSRWGRRRQRQRQRSVQPCMADRCADRRSSIVNDVFESELNDAIHVPVQQAQVFLRGGWIRAVQWYPNDPGAFLTAMMEGRNAVTDEAGATPTSSSIQLWDASVMTAVLNVHPFAGSVPNNRSSRFSANSSRSHHASVNHRPAPVVSAMKVSPSLQTTVATAALYHDAIHLVDLRSGAATHQLLGHTTTAARSGVSSLAWSTGCRYILASGGVDGNVLLYDIRKTGSRACLGRLYQHPPLTAIQTLGSKPSNNQLCVSDSYQPWLSHWQQHQNHQGQQQEVAVTDPMQPSKKQKTSGVKESASPKTSSIVVVAAATSKSAHDSVRPRNKLLRQMRMQQRDRSRCTIQHQPQQQQPATILSTLSSTRAFSATSAASIDGQSFSTTSNPGRSQQNDSAFHNYHVSPNNFGHLQGRQHAFMSHPAGGTVVDLAWHTSGHYLISAAVGGNDGPELSLWDLRQHPLSGTGSWIPRRWCLRSGMSPFTHDNLTSSTMGLPMIWSELPVSSSPSPLGTLWIRHGRCMVSYNVSTGGEPTHVLQGHLASIQAAVMVPHQGIAQSTSSASGAINMITAGRDGIILAWGSESHQKSKTREQIDRDLW